jgi:hypothetical protein
LQFSETSIWCLTDPFEFAGGRTSRFCAKATRQSGHALRSPTAVDTTGSSPAALNAEEASLYFWPVTSGDEAAAACGNRPATKPTKHRPANIATRRDVVDPVTLTPPRYGSRDLRLRAGRSPRRAGLHPTDDRLRVDGVGRRATRAGNDVRSGPDVDPAAVDGP